MSSPPRIWITTLGCSKNEVDTEKVRGMLAEAGYREAAAPDDADVVMVNTCAFIEAARRESVDAILEMAELKRSDAGLVVMGCMAQRYETELAAELPEADAVLGLERYGELVATVDELTRSDQWQPIGLRRSSMDILYETRRPTPATPFAYVKVAEGCDKLCTFCAIPSFRGKQRSRAPSNIRTEVGVLADAGVGEIVLVAQDLAAYGRDISVGGHPEAAGGIVDLVRFLSDVDGLVRLRLFYLYPREIRPGLISEMASNPLVASYFDLSLQHVSTGLLRAMKRPGSPESHRALVASILDAAPDAALRSSFIVGFPGETEEDVEALAEFLEDARLDWAGFFPFSAEEGTPASTLDGRPPASEVAERLRHLQATQDRITAERNAEQVGRTLRVVVDQVEDGTPVARSYREAPEIDGVILLDAGEPGAWLDATITGAYGTDLAAEVVPARSPAS